MLPRGGAARRSRPDRACAGQARSEDEAVVKLHITTNRRTRLRQARVSHEIDVLFLVLLQCERVSYHGDRVERVSDELRELADAFRFATYLPSLTGPPSRRSRYRMAAQRAAHHGQSRGSAWGRSGKTAQTPDGIVEFLLAWRSLGRCLPVTRSSRNQRHRNVSELLSSLWECLVAADDRRRLVELGWVEGQNVVCDRVSTATVYVKFSGTCLPPAIAAPGCADGKCGPLCKCAKEGDDAWFMAPVVSSWRPVVNNSFRTATQKGAETAAFQRRWSTGIACL